MKIQILRLNHRPNRDKRVTTHVFLASRALGATEGLLSGDEDSLLVENVNKTCRRWGGDFKVKYVKEWKKFLKSSESKIVHLTMYGIPVQDKISDIRKEKDLVVVVGGSKVPPEMYSLAHYNIAVSNQPHSEISSLAIFLHELFKGKELDLKFENSELEIVPQEKGKKVLDKAL